MTVAVGSALLPCPAMSGAEPCTLARTSTGSSRTDRYFRWPPADSSTDGSSVSGQDVAEQIVCDDNVSDPGLVMKNIAAASTCAGNPWPRHRILTQRVEGFASARSAFVSWSCAPASCLRLLVAHGRGMRTSLRQRRCSNFPRSPLPGVSRRNTPRPRRTGPPCPRLATKSIIYHRKWPLDAGINLTDWEFT